MKNKKLIIYIISILFLINIGAVNETTSSAEAQFDQSNNDTFDEIVFNWMRTFAQTVDIAHKKHYNIKDLEECIIKAINGFVSTLDAHSSLLDPKTYKEMLETTSGEFFGIGIIIDNMRKKEDKTLTIIDTIPAGPADKAGILPMDKIVEINNKTIEGLTTEKIIGLIKGERNSTVTIKVMRENSQDIVPFDVIRDIVKEQHSLSFNIKNHNIAYISLSMFTDSATEQIASLLKQTEEKNYKGLILDLRNNSGGLLTAAIKIASLFLKKGSLVTITKDKTETEVERYVTISEPILHSTMPIFILINNFTASAGEILAGALKIHSNNSNDHLVFLVGTTTFGKGSVQEVIPISNNCAVKITTHLYFLPDNTTIQGRGIEPDFLVERTSPQTEQVLWFTKHYGRENTLNNYIAVEESGKPITTSNPAPEPAINNIPNTEHNRRNNRAKEMLKKDNQLHTCITLINTLHSAQTHIPNLVKNRKAAYDYLQKNHLGNDALDIEEIKL